MHVVAVLALDGVVSFDLATPTEVFRWARLGDGRPAYKVVVCGEKRIVDAGSFDIRTPADLRAVSRVRTVIVPGLIDPTRPVPPRVVHTLRAAAKRGARIASICTGAFVLAAAGLLDGRRATTHWLAATELARMYPAVDVDPAVLYVDSGNILTSAGAAAGLDLCLHLIRMDYGASVASTRTLSRRFREQTGTTPAQWVVRLRVHRAQELLETTSHAVERIASEVRFGSTATLRERFQRVVGTSPQAYRRAFRRRR